MGLRDEVGVNMSYESLEEAFPLVAPGAEPLGPRVLLQLRSVKKKSAGGILLVEETKVDEQWNCQVAKVIAVGPLAFRNRETLEKWPEGLWIAPGDYVRCVKWGGDRFAKPVPGREEPARFLICKDMEVIAKITEDPLAVINYIG